MSQLYHVSETPGITRFEPKPSLKNPDTTDAVVWAIDEAHSVNYLLPRDCPRVCWVSETGHRVVAVELGWAQRIRDARLFLYEFSGDSFALLDQNAGYYISRIAVEPLAVTTIQDIHEEFNARQTELRILSNLWALHDEIAASATEFSMIRMRNALPRG